MPGYRWCGRRNPTGLESDIGILVRNIDASVVELRLVSGFTIGMRTLGDGRGVEDSTFHLLRILNNRYGLDIRAETATAWNTSVRYYGGHFALATGINPTIDRSIRRGARAATTTTIGTYSTDPTSRATPARPQRRDPLPERDGRHRHHRARSAHGGLLADQGGTPAVPPTASTRWPGPTPMP